MVWSMTVIEILTALDKGGTVALLLAVLVGGVRQWWVFGHHYREMRTDRDQWRTLALNGHTLSQRAVQVLASSVERPAQ